MLDHDRSASTSPTTPPRLGQHHVARVDRRAALHAGAHEGGVGLEQRHGLAHHVRAHERAVGVVVLEEGDQGRGHGPDLVRRHVHEVHVLGQRERELVVARAAGHLRPHEAALRVQLGVGLGDGVRLLLVGVEVDDLVRDLAVAHEAVRRGHEAVLRHLGVRRERADEADVRALRRLDRAHAAVVRGVHVAHLDGRPLAREAARAERRQAPAMGEARQRVRLIHELRELRGAEELLDRRHHGPDVDDGLRGDRVRVLGGEALAHHPLHAVEADAEGLLDELADGAQAPVAEVLVLVEVRLHGLAGKRDRLDGVVLDGLAVLVEAVLGDAEHLGQEDELLDELDDVVCA